MDKFVKQKLDIISREEENEEIEMPESMSARFKNIAAEFAAQKPQAASKKRGWLIPVLSSCAACLILCVSLLCVHFFKKPDKATYQDFEDCITEIAPYEQLISEYGILKYTADYNISANFIEITKRSKIRMAIQVNFYLPDGELNLTVPINSNYNFVNKSYYTQLATQRASTDFFGYNYFVSTEDKLAIAVCEYNGLTHYFWYTSDYPEDITQIMNSFAAP